MNVLLKVTGLHTYIGRYHILQGVDLEVPEGAVTVLLGRNGAGKTTTLRTIMGLWKPARGEIWFAGRRIDGLSTYAIARLGIGYVPEERVIFRGLTVEENLRIAERRPGDLARKREFIFSLFPDLERLYHWPAGQLSGGQQQMLAIARALVPDNRLILIDEPTEGLAPVIVEQLMHALRELSQTTTILLVEQNFRVAAHVATFYTIIEEGRSVHRGRMADLLANRDVVRRYLGVA